MISMASPARKRFSITFPLLRFLSLVRTNARQLPGLTCWNSTTVQRSLLYRITKPGRKSEVDGITRGNSSATLLQLWKNIEEWVENITTPCHKVKDTRVLS